MHGSKWKGGYVWGMENIAIRTKAGIMLLCWHSGQLAVSSGQVEADQFAIVYAKTHTSFPLSPVPPLLQWPPTPLQITRCAQPLRRGLQKARWLSQLCQCLCLYVSVSAPSQTTSHQPNRAAGLLTSSWSWGRHCATCQAFYAYAHAPAQTNTGARTCSRTHTASSHRSTPIEV